MIKFWLIFGAFFCFTINTNGQFKVKDNYDFHPPLKIPLVLAANFGELRTNHFHTGLDFKTNRQEGLKIYSIEDGYVSRVKVSPYGYGHVVYIDHYNGLTSVYAHCSDFVGEIESLVRKKQREKEDFAFEFYPAKDSLKVKKGQAIALSGNTGGSTAPHLHFEIRETKTEHALNPLLFGFDITDTRKPSIRGMKVYGLTAEGYRIPQKEKKVNVGGWNGSFKIHNNQLTIPADFTSKDGGVGFSFDAIDQLDAAENICGIFKAFLVINGDTIFEQNMTEIAFETNRYINCHKDYEEFHRYRKHFQKTFKTIHNPLPIYRQEKNNGIFNAQPGKSYDVKYICADTEGNSSTLSFKLNVEKGEQNDLRDLYSPSDQFLFPDSAFMNITENYSILFPPGLLYEPTPLILSYMNGVNFGSSFVPLQEEFKVMLKVENMQLPKEKYTISRQNNSGSKYAEGGIVNNGWITAWVKNFGKFNVEVDTIPPEIFYKNFRNGSNVRGKYLMWKVRDNFSEIIDYDIFIDGKWHLLNYEPKRGARYFFNAPLDLNGEKELKIRFEDACGNVAEESYRLNF